MFVNTTGVDTTAPTQLSKEATNGIQSDNRGKGNNIRQSSARNYFSDTRARRPGRRRQPALARTARAPAPYRARPAAWHGPGLVPLALSWAGWTGILFRGGLRRAVSRLAGVLPIGQTFGDGGLVSTWAENELPRLVFSQRCQMLAQPGQRPLEVTFLLVQESDQESVCFIRVNHQAPAVEAQEPIRREERHTLVAVDTWTIEDSTWQAVPPRPRF